MDGGFDSEHQQVRTEASLSRVVAVRAAGVWCPGRCACEWGDREFTKETLMPLIQAKVIEGVLTDAQKREIVHRLTDAMVSVAGEQLRPVTVVLVEEVMSGDWGIGGKPLTTADVKALAAGRSTG